MTKLLQRLHTLFPPIPAAGYEHNLLFAPKRLGAFSIALIQLLAVFIIVYRYNIEKASGIIEYTPFVIGAFLLNSFTPLRLRPFLMFALTLLLLYTAFGPVLATLMVLTGLGMIMVCHLPVKFWIRAGLIMIAFLVLAVVRAGIFNVPNLTLAVMYLAPMFMFRLVIYLYEIKHGLVPVSKWQSLAYFFMFPNILFVFFPIIDYKTYIKTYYNSQEKDLWQKGIRWMLRGMIHMLCYRFISLNLLLSPSDVTGFPSLLQYMISNYMLVLRLSGIFHFCLGLLCMFGLNLPQSFNNYFVATSFVDLWRRINIYWREFVLKIFFYPIMFFLKKRLRNNVLPVTMMIVFVITWLLHSYQLFWITGKVFIKPVDAAFWIIIGICITINSVLIEKELLSDAPPKATPSRLKKYLLTIIRIEAMFLFMSLMWSLWNSRSLEDWTFVLSKGRACSAEQLCVFGLVLLVITGLGLLAQFALDNRRISTLIQVKPQDTLSITAPSLALLMVLSLQTVRNHLPVTDKDSVTAFFSDRPNRMEQKNAEVGYYNRLIEGDEDMVIGIGGKTFKTQLRKVNYVEAYVTDNREIINRKMKPNLDIKGLDHDFRSNSFGMRDREYTIEKPDSTYRMAILGGSYEMGSGVSNNQVFEAVVEDRLNSVRPDSAYKTYEILNFSAGGYYLLEHVELVNNNNVFRFNPDVVFYFAHSGERERMTRNITNVIKRNTALKYPFLEYIKKASGVHAYMSEYRVQELLQPYTDCLIEWSYYQISLNCKKHHATPVWVYLITTTDTLNQQEYNLYRDYAQKMGFITMSMGDVYGSVDRASIQISEWNTHPKAIGQKMIAAKFYNELMRNRQLIFTRKK